LSERERQIAEAVFDDQKESVIAVHLGISSHTVHTHLERLYRKLGVTSRVTLVSRVFVEYLWLQEGHRRAPGFLRKDLASSTGRLARRPDVKPSPATSRARAGRRRGKRTP
jgi:DNA-binding CsgD family transcriptional regulator